MQWTAEGFVFGAVSLCFCLCMKSRRALNGFAPNSLFAWTGLKIKVKCQRSRSSWTKNDIFRPFRRPACGYVW